VCGQFLREETLTICKTTMGVSSLRLLVALAILGCMATGTTGAGAHTQTLSVSDGAVGTCNAVLEFTCTDSGAGGTTTATHVQFYQDGAPVTVWLDVNNSKKYKVAQTDAGDRGVYTCKGALSDAGLTPSAASNAETVACTNCPDTAGTAECMKADAKSECTGSTGSKICTCKSSFPGSFPTCACDKSGSANLQMSYLMLGLVILVSAMWSGRVC